MKIHKLKQKNLLIKIEQASKTKEVKGIVIKPGKTAYLVADASGKALSRCPDKGT